MYGLCGKLILSLATVEDHNKVNNVSEDTYHLSGETFYTQLS